jgi:hypothetical protein
MFCRREGCCKPCWGREGGGRDEGIEKGFYEIKARTVNSGSKEGSRSKDRKQHVAKRTCGKSGATLFEV